MRADSSNQSMWRRLQDRFTLLQSHLNRDADEQSLGDDVHQASRRKMSKDIRNKRMSQVVYGYLTTI